MLRLGASVQPEGVVSATSAELLACVMSGATLTDRVRQCVDDLRIAAEQPAEVDNAWTASPAGKGICCQPRGWLGRACRGSGMTVTGWVTERRP
jgi:hypothetical protein